MTPISKSIGVAVSMETGGMWTELPRAAGGGTGAGGGVAVGHIILFILFVLKKSVP